MRYTRQATECVTLQCTSNECKAKIMAEIIYNFLCLYELTKVSMISIVEDRTILQTTNVSAHHVQKTINVIESQLKPRLIIIIFTRSQPCRGGIQKAKSIMKQNDSIL